MGGVARLPLAGFVPILRISDLGTDLPLAAHEIEHQLREWGFMAVEVPTINEQVMALFRDFSAACSSASPSLNDYTHDVIPQISSGGNHGFFSFYSEVPRLARGIADPKEFIHVSGAMLDDLPSGSAGLIKAFPTLGAAAAKVFDLSFSLVTLFAEVIRGLMPDGTPPFGLARSPCNLRVVHYKNVDGREILAHEHSGIQMLGIQLPPSDQGLQYILHDGTWVEPVLAETDIVLCNIGRMLAKASNNRFRPSTHRVHANNPYVGDERWSAVLFAYPNHEDHQWVITDEGVMREDGTWGDFIRNRFVGLGGRL